MSRAISGPGKKSNLRDSSYISKGEGKRRGGRKGRMKSDEGRPQLFLFILSTRKKKRGTRVVSLYSHYLRLLRKGTQARKRHRLVDQQGKKGDGQCGVSLLIKGGEEGNRPNSSIHSPHSPPFFLFSREKGKGGGENSD